MEYYINNNSVENCLKINKGGRCEKIDLSVGGCGMQSVSAGV